MSCWCCSLPPSHFMVAGSPASLYRGASGIGGKLAVSAYDAADEFRYDPKEPDENGIGAGGRGKMRHLVAAPG
ncbi:hypothetical protein GUJ93_ZPchr0014g47362 [Zizania palustris]|uniref:Uncharacterized protein n=1 Tax=Zizania palustris TaxID=103762 RepID=A0A8J5VS10_ZIZPA|nr:hypothetical protein GUJ93_ZPchr0014g47362 [Zizania palustris]